MSAPPRWTLTASAHGPWAGGGVEATGGAAWCVLAPNPGPMTLDGTNTWILAAPGAPDAVVVDPGPDHPGHREAILAEANRRDARVGLVLLTHRHLDHSEGARALAERCAVGVRALDPRHRLGAEGLGEGDAVEAGGVRLDVIATPGHTTDSLCFVLRTGAGLPVILTGDTVLGRGTAVIAHPDGALAAYLASLHRLRGAVQELDAAALLPGHGPVLHDPAAVVQAYLEHRAERLAAVRAARDAGARTAREVVEIVYADVDRRLWDAAELSVAAQLDYLAAHP